MNDLLSAQIDIARLQDEISISDFLESLPIRGDSVVRDSSAACAVIGSPHFEDEESAEEARKKGFAAGFLNTWRQHGVAAPSRIRGAYAAIVVDAIKGSVFLAVDRFAIQTLCYSLQGEILGISDRADCVEGRGNELDPQAIFDYLFFHMIPAPRTIFKNVHRLPAAHSLLIDKDGVHEARHWPLHFDESYREPFTDARDKFLGIIRDSVTEELAGQKRVGAFLSGGTDSSTIAGMLGKVTGSPAPSFSIGFEAEGYDEMEYARIAARHFGCEHHEYYVTQNDVLTGIPAVARYHDQPFGNSSALPAYFCAQMAKADGCTRILAGDGGDELFGGNSRYAMQRFLQFYHSVPSGVRRLFEPMCGDDSVLRRIPGLRQATGYVRHSRVQMPHRLENLNLIMQLDPAAVLSADLLSRIDTQIPAQHMQTTWDQCQDVSLINKMLAYDWRYTLADSDLPKVRGATSMAGIGVAFPLLDDRMADFSMSLPPDWKLRRFKLRWFFKEALRGFLPDAILTKKKQGFGLPFGVWTNRNQDLKLLASDSLNGLAERGIIRADFAQKLISELLPVHPGYYGEMVWILMMLEQWMRGHEGMHLSA